MLAIVAPGQGAQTPGFLTPWLADPAYAEHLSWLSAVTDLDLVHYGTDADAETIRDTAIAQPLLVASALLATSQLLPSRQGGLDTVGIVAGHSVGELAAAAAARVISDEQAMVLVRERGKAMAAAAAAAPTGMTAVLGGAREEVLAKLAEHGLTAANDNGPGQIVAAGTGEQLAALAADPPARARLSPLTVAGAFHTSHMASAVGVLRGLVGAVATRTAGTRVISNRDGQVVRDGREVLTRIVAQIGRPVRWDRCMETMLALGVTGILELPPAGVLVGIARRAMKGVDTFALKTPDQLDEARAFVGKHGAPVTPEAESAGRTLVSPSRGTFRQRERLSTGGVIPAQAAIGSVAGLLDDTPVLVPESGTILEWLVGDGEPVTPGQPLIRLDPEAAGDQAEDALT